MVRSQKSIGGMVEVTVGNAPYKIGDRWGIPAILITILASLSISTSKPLKNLCIRL